MLHHMRPGLLAVVAALACWCGPADAATLTQIGRFPHPVYVAAPPGDASRVLVVEQRGIIRLFKDGVLQSRVFIDYRSRVLSGTERGLLSMAFAPDYTTSGRLYLYFTNLDGDIEIDMVKRAASTPDAANRNTARTLLVVPHPDYANHDGGQLQF